MRPLAAALCMGKGSLFWMVCQGWESGQLRIWSMGWSNWWRCEWCREDRCPPVIINAKGWRGGTVNERLSVCVYVCFYFVTCVCSCPLSPWPSYKTYHPQPAVPQSSFKSVYPSSQTLPPLIDPTSTSVVWWNRLCPDQCNSVQGGAWYDGGEGCWPVASRCNFQRLRYGMQVSFCVHSSVITLIGGNLLILLLFVFYRFWILVLRRLRAPRILGTKPKMILLLIWYVALFDITFHFTLAVLRYWNLIVSPVNFTWSFSNKTWNYSNQMGQWQVWQMRRNLI